MYSFSLRIYFLRGCIVLSWMLAGSASAQIIPDTTLPTDSVVPLGCTNCNIIGGTSQGGNLFHSFDTFSVPTGGSAQFIHSPDISLIFSRVTGDKQSQIDGLIATSGLADLFFINPNGVLFGPNASLNVGGSFIATSADRINFADGTQFVASPQTSPLLTVTAPVGLQFGSNPGDIVNQSNAGPFPNSIGALFGLGNLALAGLQGFPGATVALVGGELRLEGGNITAHGGHVELGSVAGNNTVLIEPSSFGWQFDYTTVSNFQDITLSDLALVDVTDLGVLDGVSGSANVQGQNITLSGASGILGFNFGAEPGGTLKVSASDRVHLQGAELALGLTSSISTYALGTAAAGDIQITSQDLRLEDGGAISTLPLGGGGGDSGNLTIQVTDLIEVLGTAQGAAPSAISIQVLPLLPGPIGNGQTLSIETARLVIRDGAQISSTTFGEGNAGDVQIFASESVELVGSTLGGSNPSAISTSVEVDGLGNAGDLTIETPRLTLLDGAQISSSTRGQTGDGGDLSIKASEFVRLSGTSENATLTSGSSGIFVSIDPASVNPFTGELVIPTGDSGNLEIETPLLTVENGARISADTFSFGAGGQAVLNVNQLLVRSGGQVRAGSLVEDNAPSNERGPGGLLRINATELVEVKGSGFIGETLVNSTLFTAAEGTGAAGSLFLTTPQLLVTDGGEITVSAPNSVAGNLTVNAEDIRLNQGTLSAVTGLSADAAGGANIFLRDTQLLLLENESLISASALENANGGNIDIEAEFVIGLAPTGADGSDITANAVRGNGGAVTITTTLLSGLTFRPELTPENDITVTSQFGLAGTFIQNDLDVDPTEGLAELPANVVDPTGLIDRSCDLAAQDRPSEFIVTGRGGLPPTPRDRTSPNQLLDDLGETSPTETVPSAPSQALPDPTNTISTSEPMRLQEAQGWRRDRNGRLHLVAATPTDTRVGQSLTTCTAAN